MKEFLDSLFTPLWLKFDDQWARALDGLDIITLIGISVICLFMFRSAKIDNRLAIAFPMFASAAYGALTAWEAAQQGYTMAAQMIFFFKAIVLNGAVALGISAFGNLLIENWPAIRKIILRKFGLMR